MEKKELAGENKSAVLPMKRLIWQLGLPMVVSMILQAVYNIVDTVFVINMGEEGVAGNLALTYAFPIQLLMIAVGVGTGIGINALLSKNLGEKKMESAARAAGNGIFLGICIYAVFLLFGIFGAEWFIRLQANGNEQVVEMGATYLRICCIFSFGCVGFSVYERLLQSTGKTSYSTAAQIVGALLNIVLDYVFIYPCGWGIAGAAWATIIGQIASLLIAMALHYCKNREIDGSLQYIRPRGAIIGQIYRIGASAAIMQALLSVMMFGMNLILGTAASAEILQGSFGIYYKIMQFALFAFFGLSNTIITVLSFNYGMGDKARVKQAIFWGIADTVTVAVIVTVLFECLALPLATLFGMASGEAGEEIRDVVVVAIRIAAVGYIFMAFSVAVQGVLQAFRYAIRPLVISLLRLVVVVLPVAWLFTLSQNAVNTVWWSLVIAEVVTALISAAILADTYKKKVVPMVETAAARGNLIVTISRQHGSNGKQIGRLVAQKLGISFYDKEIAARVAEETGLAREYLERPLDQVPSFKAVYLSTDTNRRAIVEQAKVIRKIAETEPCVIVGRGADYILRKNQNVVSVFIHADRAFRVATIMKLYGDDEAAALKHMQRSDEARSTYYWFISGKQWGDRSHYDLCIDSSVGAEQTAELIVAYVRDRQAQTGA